MTDKKMDSVAYNHKQLCRLENVLIDLANNRFTGDNAPITKKDLLTALKQNRVLE